MTVAERAASATAHGKVILLGEHTVVYGAPALAAGIDRGARATATMLAPSDASLLCLAPHAPVAPADSSDVARAFAALLAESAIAFPVRVEASTELPQGGGLGCSAALAVAIARAVLSLAGPAGRPERPPSVLACATAWERVFHGNPSGVDTTAAARGGCFRFTRALGAAPLTLARPLVLTIGWSGHGASTREMVDGVARLFERSVEHKRAAIDGITAIVDEASRAAEAGDLEALGALLDRNQAVLDGMRLSTAAIDRLCNLARGAGAFGAKLTGKGGGGSVLALVEGESGAARVLSAWQREGFDGFATRIRASGDVEKGTTE